MSIFKPFRVKSLRLHAAGRRVAALLLYAAFQISAFSQTNVSVTWNFADFGNHTLNIRRATITPIARGRPNFGRILSARPMEFTAVNYPNLTNGTLSTNLLAGYAYILTFTDNYGNTSVTNYFGTNLANTSVNGADTIGWIVSQEGSDVTQFAYLNPSVTNVSVAVTVTGGAVVAGAGLTSTISGGTNTLSLYAAPTISSFINNQNLVEKGSTIAATLLTWVLAGGAITNQSLDNGLGSLAISLRATNHTQTYTLDRTYTLTTTDGITTNTATTGITFLSKAYWGVSANTSLTDGQIIALASSAFATTRANSFTVSPSAQYIYVAYPATFGVATFVINGLPNTDWTLVTRSFVNTSSFGSSYNIYRQNNVLTGTFSVIVQ